MIGQWSHWRSPPVFPSYQVEAGANREYQRHDACPDLALRQGDVRAAMADLETWIG